VEPQECAVVGDSLPGIQAGVAAGMEVLAFQPNDVDPGIPPGVVIVKRLSDLQSIIGAGQAADHEQPMI
jgi:beta-phosphoglucomutase-like phosphatase (HAD superfamily)